MEGTRLFNPRTEDYRYSADCRVQVNCGPSLIIENVIVRLSDFYAEMAGFLDTHKLYLCNAGIALYMKTFKMQYVVSSLGSVSRLIES